MKPRVTTDRSGVSKTFCRWMRRRGTYRSLIVVLSLCGVFMVVFSFQLVSTPNRAYVVSNCSMSADGGKDSTGKQLRETSTGINMLDRDSTPSLKMEIKDEYDRQSNALGLKPIHRKFINFQYPVTINRPYLIENPTLCSSVPNLTVLVIVHTAPRNFERRQNARRTWANDTYYRDLGRLKILFLLGTVNDQEMQNKIKEEFAEHRDLLQGDFVDAYHNLTHKGVMAYKWITQRCRNAKAIVKVDDDVMVDTYKLFTSPEYLPFFEGKTKQIVCNHIFPDTMPILRDNKSKWYVKEEEFKGETSYPRYCSGFFVMFTNDVIPAIYRAATVTPFFWVDDVYLYGLAPIRVRGIRYTGIKHGTHMLAAEEAVQCYRNLSKTCDYIVTGAPNVKLVDTIWDIMTYIYRHNGNRPTTPAPPTTAKPPTQPPTTQAPTTQTPTTQPSTTQPPPKEPPPPQPQTVELPQKQPEVTQAPQTQPTQAQSPESQGQPTQAAPAESKAPEKQPPAVETQPPPKS